MINCILAGVGGQGIVLASRLIAVSAMNKGMMVRTTETIGMAQRGGCVVSHVRIGNEIHSPLVPLKSADVIIGFEPAEAVRYMPYLKEDGTVIVSNNAIKPVTDALSEMNYRGDEMLEYLHNNVRRLIEIDAETVFAECASSKVLNTALLGAASAAGVLGFSTEDLEKAIFEVLPQKYVDINLKALHTGADTVVKGRDIG